jgi:hypothetical protein
MFQEFICKVNVCLVELLVTKHGLLFKEIQVIDTLLHLD